MENNENVNEEYVMPTEPTQSGGIELPKNLNTWFVVIVVSGISAIFTILTTLQNGKINDEKANAARWEQRYNKQVRKTDSIQAYYQNIITNKGGDDFSIEKFVKMKYTLYKIDSITNSHNPNEKISKTKLNNEIKSALIEE